MKISVITATFNAADVAGRLIHSLETQSDLDFEWIVVDGGSTDTTLDLIGAVSHLRAKIISGPDRGIYDALNKGINLATSDYYFVVGADDALSPDAISNYKTAIAESGADIICATVTEGERLIRPRSGHPSLQGGMAFMSHHAVGTLLRRSLHDRFGPYQLRYRVVADQDFIKRAMQGGATRHVAPFMAGYYGTQGFSSSNTLLALTESFDYQLRTERGRWLQVALYALRLVYRTPKILRQTPHTCGPRSERRP